MTIFNYKLNGKISALIILCSVLGSGTLDASRPSPSTLRRASSGTSLGRSPVRALSSPTLGTSTMASTPEPKATTTVISVGDFRTRFDTRLEKQKEFAAYIAAIKTALGRIDVDVFKRFIADFIFEDRSLNTSSLETGTDLSRSEIDSIVQEYSITKLQPIRTRIIAFKETTNVYKADPKFTQIYGSSMSVYRIGETIGYIRINLDNGIGVFFKPVESSEGEYKWEKLDNTPETKGLIEKKLDSSTLLNPTQFYALSLDTPKIYQLQALIDLKLYKDITHEGINKRFIVELGKNKYINLGSKTLYTKYDGTIKDSSESSDKTAICLLGTEELKKLANDDLPQTLKLTSDTSKEEAAAATRIQAAFRLFKDKKDLKNWFNKIVEDSGSTAAVRALSDFKRQLENSGYSSSQYYNYVTKMLDEKSRFFGLLSISEGSGLSRQSSTTSISSSEGDARPQVPASSPSSPSGGRVAEAVDMLEQRIAASGSGSSSSSGTRQIPGRTPTHMRWDEAREERIEQAQRELRDAEQRLQTATAELQRLQELKNSGTQDDLSQIADALRAVSATEGEAKAARARLERVQAPAISRFGITSPR